MTTSLHAKTANFSLSFAHHDDVADAAIKDAMLMAGAYRLRRRHAVLITLRSRDDKLSQRFQGLLKITIIDDDRVPSDSTAMRCRQEISLET